MRRAVLLLAGLCAFGAAGALAQQPAPEGLVPAPAENPDAAALNPLATLDKGTLTGFRDMPLFTPSRKRPTPPPPEAPAAEPEPEPAAPEAPEPELKLSGVIEGPEGAVAVVEKDGEIERLRLGDQVDGWLVTGIEGLSLKLTLNEREKEYRLFQRADGSQPQKGESEGASDGTDEGGEAGEAEKPEGEGAQEPADADAQGSEPDASGAGSDPSADTPEGEQPPADQPEGGAPDDKSGEDPADEAK